MKFSIALIGAALLFGGIANAQPAPPGEVTNPPAPPTKVDADNYRLCYGHVMTESRVPAPCLVMREKPAMSKAECEKAAQAMQGVDCIKSPDWMK